MAYILDIDKRNAVYKRWTALKSRAKKRTASPTYPPITVHQTWSDFLNFLEWVENQPAWEGLELDKDILSPDGMGTEYGPDTCAFIPKYLNGLFRASHSRRSRKLPMGVDHYAGKRGDSYYSRITVDGVTKSLGIFKTAEAAHRAWQRGLEKRIDELLKRYRAEPGYLESVDLALQQRRDKIKADRLAKLETTGWLDIRGESA